MSGVCAVRADLVIAHAATLSPDEDDRVVALLYVATHHATFKRPTWWRWTTWLAFGITAIRLERAKPGTLSREAPLPQAKVVRR